MTMVTLAGETTTQSRPLTEVRLRFFRRRVDWLLLAVLLAATLPSEVFDWITFEKAPSGFHFVFLLAILLLSLVHLPALWTSPVVMVIGREALIWPSCYAEPIPWDAVSDVRRNGNTISVTIEEGQRFGRATTVFYHMFPEQKRVREDDSRSIDCNTTSLTANELMGLLEAHSEHRNQNA